MTAGDAPDEGGTAEAARTATPLATAPALHLRSLNNCLPPRGTQWFLRDMRSSGTALIRGHDFS